MSVDRGEAWEALGAPSDQVGSVNDPRTYSDYDVEWNEKWVYLSGGEVVRVVLWNRYDLMGVFCVKPDGSAEREPFPGE